LHCALNPPTQEDLVSTSLSRQRLLLLLFATFAAWHWPLASIGIYGVLAHLMGQRVPEFGLRMALGANAHDVMGIVLRQNLRLVGAALLSESSWPWRLGESCSVWCRGCGR
jgi:hypothetical protein